jgi:hypothetical protein
MRPVHHGSVTAFGMENDLSTIGYPASALGAPALPRLRPAPRLRITSRGRAVVAVLLAIPLVVVALALGINAGSATALHEAPAASFTWVNVEPGQSLWQLAESVAPEADPREVVAEIVALNQLPSADVQAGQLIALPPRYAP